MNGRLFSLGLCVVIFNCIGTTHGGAGSQWTYNGTLGPADWHIDYPRCGGQKQSPVNIVINKVEYNSDLDEFDLSDLDITDGVKMSLKNVEGHTVEVTLSGSKRLEVRRGGLETPYIVKQFHFHWGAKDERGSEHDINNKQFPMEMHVVLYSTKYGNMNDAGDKTRGLAVLSFLFEPPLDYLPYRDVVDCMLPLRHREPTYVFPVGENNDNFDPLLKHFSQIQHSGNETAIPTLPVMSLLPNDTATYFRYDGSLTTPPCYESVVWSVFTTRITVAEEQLERFRHIKRIRDGTVEGDLVDDFRPLQDLNHRIVYTNDKALSAGSNVNPPLTALGLALSTLTLRNA